MGGVVVVLVWVLMVRVLRCHDVGATNWTGVVVVFDPGLEALCMEVVALIALELCHQVLVRVFIQTDNTLSLMLELLEVVSLLVQTVKDLRHLRTVGRPPVQ